MCSNIVFIKKMKNILLIVFFSISMNTYSQKYYDKNDFKYYLDFTHNLANLKFQDYKIEGKLEEVKSFYGNVFTIIKGDSIHWILEQNNNRKEYSSYLLIKGEYDEILKLARRGVSNKKFEIIDSDIIFSGSFIDFFNFVDETEFEKISRDRLVGTYLRDFGFFGSLPIKIYRNNGINYQDLDIIGKITLTDKDVLIETNLPTLTKFVGEYDSELNKNFNLLKQGIVSGKIKFSNNGLFSLSIDKEQKIGTLTTLESIKSNDSIPLSQRKTTTFKILD